MTFQDNSIDTCTIMLPQYLSTLSFASLLSNLRTGPNHPDTALVSNLVHGLPCEPGWVDPRPQIMRHKVSRNNSTQSTLQRTHHKRSTRSACKSSDHTITSVGPVWPLKSPPNTEDTYVRHRSLRSTQHRQRAGSYRSRNRFRSRSNHTLWHRKSIFGTS